MFTYKGTCTRDGELIVKNPEKKAERSRESAAAARAAAKGAGQGGSQSPLARARSRLAARVTKKVSRPSRGGRIARNGSGHGKRGGDGDGDGDASPEAPKKPPMTFKRIMSGAVEEGLGTYENGARLQILFGVLLNVPWLLVLWFGRGSNTSYVAD